MVIGLSGGKECCLNVSSRLWGGALRDDAKNGCEGDYGMTHNALRQAGYWIINRRASVSQLLRKCTIRRKLRVPAQVQKVANLPEERVTPASPFTYSGMDVSAFATLKRAGKS